MKRVLLIGGAGQLGTAIRQRWKDCAITAPLRDELDLADAAALRRTIEAVRPDVVVNAAAFHDVDRCEDEPERAFAINAEAVGAAATAARDCNAVFVTISTDYVFDGETSAPYAEEAAPNPISVYGASKLAGERRVEALGTRAFVVRTCGLFGRTAGARVRPSFIDRVLSQRSDEAPMRVVSDVVASPTFAGDLAFALGRLLETDSYGLYHAVDAGAVSWYEFALEAIRQSGAAVEVEPILGSQRRSRAARPRFSALANARLGGLGITLPSWRDGIAAYLQSTAD